LCWCDNRLTDRAGLRELTQPRLAKLGRRKQLVDVDSVFFQQPEVDRVKAEWVAGQPARRWKLGDSGKLCQ